MSFKTIGIVDYGIGNHTSVTRSLRDLGFRVRVSSDERVLEETDVLVLPGVGAYPAAMRALHSHGLVRYLQNRARAQHPIIGICLGMQLLASASYEHCYTAGLDIIPGEIVPLADLKWHIGWNTIECIQQDSLMQASDGQAFYFNHSFTYRGPAEYQICISRHPNPFPSVIRRGNVVGVQFHPEKSQADGKILLKKLIMGLGRA